MALKKTAVLLTIGFLTLLHGVPAAADDAAECQTIANAIRAKFGDRSRRLLEEALATRGKSERAYHDKLVEAEKARAAQYRALNDEMVQSCKEAQVALEAVKKEAQMACKSRYASTRLHEFQIKCPPPLKPLPSR